MLVCDLELDFRSFQLQSTLIQTFVLLNTVLLVFDLEHKAVKLTLMTRST